MKKKKNLFGGFPIVGMRKKKKKICSEGSWMGYCPFESRYNGLYRDTEQLGTAAGATIRPGHAHDTAW